MEYKWYTVKLTKAEFKKIRMLEVDLDMERKEFLFMLIDLLKERMEDEQTLGRLRNKGILIYLTEEEFELLAEKVKKTKKTRQEILIQLIQKWIYK